MLYLSLGAAVFNLRVGAAQLGYRTDFRSVLVRRRPAPGQAGLTGQGHGRYARRRQSSGRYLRSGSATGYPGDPPGQARRMVAGRQAVQRVLLEATVNGVSTSLLNQAVEHDALPWLLHDQMGPWTRPQAVIRFDYGPLVPPKGHAAGQAGNAEASAMPLLVTVA
jgi:hypothetical protein